MWELECSYTQRHDIIWQSVARRVLLRQALHEWRSTSGAEDEYLQQHTPLVCTVLELMLVHVEHVRRLHGTKCVGLLRGYDALICGSYEIQHHEQKQSEPNTLQKRLINQVWLFSWYCRACTMLR